MKWLYKKNKKNTVRYILGEIDKKGKRTLICFGVNPSTASPNNLDNTLKRVKSHMINQNYSSWIMLNVYPQRTTDPNNLHSTLNNQIHKKNLKFIRSVLRKYKRNSDILFAYGDLISTRPFLDSCLKNILSLIKRTKYCGRLYCIKKTKNNNPVHPLYQPINIVFVSY